MTHSQLNALYLQRANHFQDKQNSLQKRINTVSTLRVLIAAAILYSGYLTLQQSGFGLLVFVLVIVFAGLMQWHSRLFAKRAITENLAKLNNNEASTLRGDISRQLPGTEFIDTQHPYTHDLDIFGEGSLFQYLNRTSTIPGRQRLAHALAFPSKSASEVTEKQEAIRELSEKLEFRQLFQATAGLVHDTKNDVGQLTAWLTAPSLLSKHFKYILFILPALTVAAVATTFFIGEVKPVAVLLVLSQWILMGVYLKRINAFHDYVSRKKNVLEKYAELLALVNKEEFTAVRLQRLSAESQSASDKLSKLASNVRALDARLNFMTNIVVNGLFLYDFQYVYRLERWKEFNGKQLLSWIETVSEMEVLGSLGTHAFNNADFCYADVHTNLTVEAEGLGHPLIKSDERIVNNFSIGQPHVVQIITGANMAGKSTFLRTLGVNFVLALNGAKVCAQKFSCPVIQLRSGMRSADSLKDHQSYFYAELNRLHAITEELKQNVPMLVLLDEILRGTNSTDKQAGSIALVKQLIQWPCLAVVATHDLAMGELENQLAGKVINYHFEPTIENDQLSFDYKLKRGIAEKMNATFLMKKMGIIPT